ncbi:MAG: Hpt domain-containing protein [Alphaproteobacteria bacterium]
MNAMKEQMEQLTDQLRVEFIEDAHEMLDRFDGLVVNAADGAGDPGAALHEARRIVHTLRGAGGTHDFPELSIIALRASDYLAEIEAISGRHRDDLQRYTDALRRALAGQSLRPSAFKQEIRQLPSRWSFNVGDVEVREVEVLLVSTARAVSRKVRSELEACGYRVVTVSQPIAALELAIRTLPDLVISSTVFDTMTGVDLARALGAISATEQIPFALLTSFARGHPELNGLPVDAAIIRVGPLFADDVADVLGRFEIG